jgi:hypothetical protein
VTRAYPPPAPGRAVPPRPASTRAVPPTSGSLYRSLSSRAPRQILQAVPIGYRSLRGYMKAPLLIYVAPQKSCHQYTYAAFITGVIISRFSVTSHLERKITEIVQEFHKEIVRFHRKKLRIEKKKLQHKR